MSSNIYQNTDTDKILTENQSKNSVLLQGSKPVVVPYKPPAISDNDKNLRIKIKEPEEEPDDNIFYNIDIVNRLETLIPIKAEYDVNRVDAVLQNPSLYNVSVVRFEIPTTIPLFIFPEPSKYEFLIALEDLTNPLVPIVSKFPVVFVDYCTGCFYERGVYYVNHFLKMVNTTLKTCYDDMKLINPGYLPTQAPYITYDPATTLMTLWADEEYLDIDRYQILMSNVLHNQFFGSFLSKAFFQNVTAINKTDVQLLVEDQYTNSEVVNGTLLYKMIGEYSTLPLFNQIQQILIETDSFNIEGEIQSGTLPNVRRLLTDFEPPSDISNRQYYTYNPSIYRWYNLLSTTPMTRVSCKVFITYSTGESFPLYLLFNELVSIKLLFKLKKNL
jgi:hypothetical protein